MNEIFKCLKKDLTIEFRNKTSFALGLTFSAITTLTIGLITAGTPLSPKIHSILLWVIIFFSAMNGLANVFTREVEEGTSLFLLLNHSSETIYISKLLFNLIFFIFLIITICPLYLFFLQIFPENILIFILSILSGSIAIASITTIFGAMVSRAGGKGSLLTTITFPLILPVLWMAIGITESALTNTIISDIGPLIFLLAFSGLVICFSYLLFRYIWMEF